MKVNITLVLKGRIFRHTHTHSSVSEKMEESELSAHLVGNT